MKKILMRCLCALALLVCTLNLCMAEESVLIVSSDYEPYTSSRDNGSGAVLDLIRQAFAEMHRDVIFQFYPWARCELMIKEGRAFGAAPYFENEERLEKYDFSAPIIYSFNRFFYNKTRFPSGFSWNSLDDFRGYRVGGIIGYWYIPEFNRAGLTIDYVSNDLANLQKLVLNRIDFLVLDELAEQKILEDNFSSKDAGKIGELEKSESFIKFHLMISRAYPNHAELTAEFDRGLMILKKKGLYTKVLQRYGLSNHFAVGDSGS